MKNRVEILWIWHPIFFMVEIRKNTRRQCDEKTKMDALY